MTVTETNTYRVDHGKYHTYYIDGEKVKGATTLINAGLPKNLAKWGSEQTANKAIDQWSKLARMPVSQRLKELLAAPWENRDGAAIKGTRVHALAEKLGHGESITVPSDIKGYVEACRAFHADWNIKPMHVELPVFSRKHKYGGTVDLIADNHIWDYKTSRSGIWGSTAFQLAAYRYADFWIDDQGQEQPMPEVEGARGVWLREDGSYVVYPLESTRHVFRQFLAIAQVAEAADDEKTYRGDAIAAPTTIIGDAHA